MTAIEADEGDPFRDQPARALLPQSGVVENCTLLLGRDASLTLGTDSLVLLDEALTRRKTPTCCGFFTSNNPIPTRSIPFFNILWAELSDFDLTVQYAQPVSKDVVRVSFISYNIHKSDRIEASRWIEQLLDRAYGTARRQKRIKVLINPFGGAGKAQKRYLRDIEPIFSAARCNLSVERTQHSGHAVDIARDLDIDSYDVIAACSGDGVPHEVFNGLGQRKEAARALANISVVQMPCGTGNAMSLNLNGTNSPSLAALAVVKGIETPLDLISITQGDRRTLSFLSQSAGIVAESDLGTENLRWMGSARFTYGFVARLFGKTVYPCEIAVGVVDADKASIKAHYQEQIARYTSQDSTDIASAPSTPHTSTDESSNPELPPLRFGTINDLLPSDWQLTPYPTLGNFYAGNMSYMAASTNFFQAALPSDGCLDLVCIDGKIPRRSAIQLLLAVGNGKLFNMPEVSYRKVSGYRIIPKPTNARREGYISIDGERVPFEPFQVEVHRGLGRVLSKSGMLYESPPL